MIQQFHNDVPVDIPINLYNTQSENINTRSCILESCLTVISTVENINLNIKNVTLGLVAKVGKSLEIMAMDSLEL